MKMRFSITSLLLLVGINLVIAEPHDFTKPLTELSGSYEIKKTDHQSSRPTWASVWSVDGDEDFGVFFWPPKFCHAIYICVVPVDPSNAAAAFDKFDCDSQYIKYFPHIGELYFKDKQGGTEEKVFHQHYSLFFQQTAPDTYSFLVQNEAFKSFSKWHEAQGALVEKTWEIKDSQLLILTNSRMCEVNKGGEFQQMFDMNTITAHSGWPSWLSQHTGTPIHTDAIASYHKTSTKTVDLLEYLKSDAKLNYTDAPLQQISQRCNSFEKVGVAGSTKPVFESSPVVSVASYKLARSTETMPNGFALKFELSVANCQWLRIWATSKGMDAYKTDMDPKDTLDIFFNEGFFVSTDEDQAKPLPDGRQIDKIKLLFYPDPETPATDEAPLGEFVFGSHDNGYLFRQHFYSKNFGANNVWFHVIKSPKCESNIMADNPFSFGSTGSAQLPNLLKVEDCQFGRFDDERLKPSSK